MARVSGGLEIMRNSDAGQLQVFALLFAAELVRAFGVVAVVALRSLARFDLCFHIFAFPSSRHTFILPHFAAGADVKRKKSRTGCAAGPAEVRRSESVTYAIDDLPSAQSVLDGGQRADVRGRVLTENGEIGLETRGDSPEFVSVTKSFGGIGRQGGKYLAETHTGFGHENVFTEPES